MFSLLSYRSWCYTYILLVLRLLHWYTFVLILSLSISFSCLRFMISTGMIPRCMIQTLHRLIFGFYILRCHKQGGCFLILKQRLFSIWRITGLSFDCFVPILPHSLPFTTVAFHNFLVVHFSLPDSKNRKIHFAFDRRPLNWFFFTFTCFVLLGPCCNVFLCPRGVLCSYKSVTSSSYYFAP